MKKIGIVGGVAWLSTVAYYSEICRRSEEWHHAQNRAGLASIPEMSIESLDISQAVAYLGVDGDEQSWDQFDEYHRAALQRLEASGADFALMASNTPHHRFSSIVRDIGIPVISILDVTAKEAARLGFGEVLLLGTDLTMNSITFCSEFSRHGILAGSPHDPQARARILRLIEQLQQGKSAGAAEELGRIARARFHQFETQPLVCLACTELPLAFPELKTRSTFAYEGVTYLNTTALHIQAAFEFALAT